MSSLLRAIRVGLLDMRGDLRRFVLLVACLAIGTALIGGVGSIGASITEAMDRSAAELMGGDLELSRADRPATPEELDAMRQFGRIAPIVDTNLRAKGAEADAFVDLVAAGEGYPLVGHVVSPELGNAAANEFLSEQDGAFGALVDAVMLDQLGIGVGDRFQLGGTEFEARGTLSRLPDAAVRGFKLGLTTLISTDAFATVSDRTSPLPGLGVWYRYKLLLEEGDAEAVQGEIATALADTGWTIRTARDGLGDMVRYYDQFMRFLMIVGLGSLLIGGVSVWTSMQAYIAERTQVIAVLRSIGATHNRVLVHFLSQVGALALVGVVAGIAIGGGVAYFVLPYVGEAMGIGLRPSINPQPLLVAAAAGILTAFAFSFQPLQRTQAIRPILLFRAKGLDVGSAKWTDLLRMPQGLPMIIAGIGLFWLAYLITGDALLVAAFAVASALSVVLFQLFVRAVRATIAGLPEMPGQVLRHAVRSIAVSQTAAASIVTAVGMTLTMLIIVLVLQGNLRQEFLGASAFDVPTLVASDLFPDEMEDLEAMRATTAGIEAVVATPMLRGALAEVAGEPVDTLRPRGPEATFLLSGEVPLTYRDALPTSSVVTAGEWWPANYEGPGLVSLHRSLREGLGVDIGDELTFSIFGEPITVTVASFRDYSWQGGIDFLATFSPGVLEEYPTTLFAAVTAAPGAEEPVERALASTLPDVNFIPVGETLKQVTDALQQLSFAALLVGGLAVGNGLLVVLGSIATGLKQREADAVINKMLGKARPTILTTALVQYLVLGLLAAIPAMVVGLGLGWLVSRLLTDVEFTAEAATLFSVVIASIALTGALGAATLLRATTAAPARLLREL